MVDGAQTAGLVPVGIQNCTGRCLRLALAIQYLFGFTGTGGFFISDPTRISPSRQGGTGTFSKSPFQPMDLPEKFEPELRTTPGLFRSEQEYGIWKKRVRWQLSGKCGI